MTEDQFDAAHRGFRRRQPFSRFLIEFASGTQLLISHPEAVRSEGQMYVTRCPDGGYVLFADDGVTRLLDVPTPTSE